MHHQEEFEEEICRTNLSSNGILLLKNNANVNNVGDKERDNIQAAAMNAREFSIEKRVQRAARWKTL